jgi:hypothetical protein
MERIVVKLIAFLVGMLCLALCDVFLEKWISKNWLRMCISFCFAIGFVVLLLTIYYAR